ncbi:CD63 antigen-like [Mizuhopecten yessoensis]|uniref:Tetraspanin n=1 Tax=Mizuhopecten yessoensis TaxID=6573 RepID=A0A210R305_MIZYE|nr:CD63 antigen-like [Mizuhopecten yessoensis]XP_021369058.1 CD63 antigen-like [Mizuhopecten yessoensis]XP_021369067.1 CD63 antigen-like [Mizuhopecten yessoensis]OWF55408.1 CD82 antigen [Mizuhopecten yessoensis]
MGCFATCGKILLVIVNLLFLVIGLVFFILGFFCKFGNDTLKGYYEGALASLSTSLSDSGFGTVDLSSFDITEVIGTLGIAFIAIGTILLVITVFGFIGACCKIRCMLIGYCILVGLIVVGQIVFFGILFGNKTLITDQIKTPLKSSIQSDFQGLNGTNVVSLAWNFVHIQVKCCGVDSYEDFTGATLWPTNYPSYFLKTPLSCCMTLPSTTDFSCAASPTTSNNYKDTGCFDSIWDLALGNVGLMAGIFAGMGLFQIMLIVFGICVIMDGKQNRVGSSTSRNQHNRKRNRWDD